MFKSPATVVELMVAMEEVRVLEVEAAEEVAVVAILEAVESPLPTLIF